MLRGCNTSIEWSRHRTRGQVALSSNLRKSAKNAWLAWLDWLVLQERCEFSRKNACLHGFEVHFGTPLYGSHLCKLTGGSGPEPCKPCKPCTKEAKMTKIEPAQN